jgi:hypothetical protein
MVVHSKAAIHGHPGGGRKIEAAAAAQGFKNTVFVISYSYSSHFK